jgi:pentatricopeptide repeat protein
MKAFAAQRPRSARGPADSVMRENLPDAMVFYARAEYPVALDTSGETIRYYRPWRDVMLENILRAADWKRPVYVAVTCDREAFSGLEDYFRLEGLAWRVTPIPSREEPYLLRSAVRDCLFGTVPGMRADRSRGFIHRSHFHSASYINPAVEGLATNYRNVYLRYAEHSLRFAGDAAGTVKALRAMNAAFPRMVYPMDYRSLYDIAVLFRQVRAMGTWAALRDIVIAGCRADLLRHPEAVTGVYSPYRYLLDVYVQDGDLSRALSLLDEMQRRAPDAGDIRAKREELLKERQNTYSQ